MKEEDVELQDDEVCMTGQLRTLFCNLSKYTNLHVGIVCVIVHSYYQYVYYLHCLNLVDNMLHSYATWGSMA